MLQTKRIFAAVIAVLVLAALSHSVYAQEELMLPGEYQYSDSVYALDTIPDVPKDKETASEYVQVAKSPEKLKLVKRGYVYRQQLGLALGMMAFVAVIMITTQNWNPD